MDIISKSLLTQIKTTYDQTRVYSSLNEATKLKNKRRPLSNEISIFLSHKHDQKAELSAAIALLRKVNVNIYVDWADDGMPKKTSGVTAVRIKEQIKSCKKFILLATEQAITSKWCNWELGIGDVHKYIDNIALLAIKEDYSAWSGSEYLEIYPIIGRKHNFSNQYFEVQFPNGRTVDLFTWMNS